VEWTPASDDSRDGEFDKRRRWCRDPERFIAEPIARSARVQRRNPQVFLSNAPNRTIVNAVLLMHNFKHLEQGATP
jgi:hypothetical protein